MTMNVCVIKKEKEEGKKWPQILAILNASSIAIMSGILFAWTSPFISKIVQDESYNITESQASWFTMIHPLGICVTSPFVIPLPNKIGRKPTILLASLFSTTALLIKAFAKNLWALYFSRFLFGFGDSLIFAGISPYIGEVAEPSIRGLWGNSLVICLFFGQFIVNIVGSYCSIPTTSFIFLTIPVIFWCTFIFMPESPYYYVMIGKYDDAKQSLRRLRRKFDVDVEFENIKSAVEQQLQDSASLKDLIFVKANRNALRAGALLRVSQALSGIYAFASYSQLIFEKAGGIVTPQTSAILQTGLTFFMYTCSSYASNLMGRRKSYLISVSLSAIILFLEAIYFYISAKMPEIDLEFINWFPLGGMLAFVVVSSIGVGVIPILMTTELFATNIKSQAICIVTVLFAFATFAVNYTFYYLDKLAGGLYGPFLLYGCCNVLSFIAAYFVVPETKNITLEEIQDILKNM